MRNFAYFQIGKNGINEGVIDSLALAFKTHKIMRISALKGSGRDRESIKQMASELAEKMEKKTGNSYATKIIGFTIILTRHMPHKKSHKPAGREL